MTKNELNIVADKFAAEIVASEHGQQVLKALAAYEPGAAMDDEVRRVQDSRAAGGVGTLVAGHFAERKFRNSRLLVATNQRVFRAWRQMRDADPQHRTEQANYYVRRHIAATRETALAELQKFGAKLAAATSGNMACDAMSWSQSVFEAAGQLRAADLMECLLDGSATGIGQPVTIAEAAKHLQRRVLDEACYSSGGSSMPTSNVMTMCQREAAAKMLREVRHYAE